MLPTIILVVSYLLSTALSVVPRISFFGSYVRMQGTWSYLSYVAIFAMVLTHVRSRAQVNRIFYAVIMTSLPIAIYGILQKTGLDPLPWGGDVVERVAANMGNSIFVAAYLIMAVFLTLERLLDSLAAIFSTEQGSIADSLRAGAYFFILAVQMMAIVFTQSRGPWGGLLAGLYVFAMLGLLLLARWAQGRAKIPAALDWLTRNIRAAWLGLIGLTLAGLIALVILNVPQGPLNGLCQKRYVGRLCTVFSTSQGTNAVRTLIWEGVVDLMLKPHAPIQTPEGQPDPLNIVRPLVGYGPESMWVAYNRFYPPDLAHYEARNASPDRSHNETFDTLVRGGLIQFAAQIFLYVSIFYYSLRWLGLMRGRRRRNLFSRVAGRGRRAGRDRPADRRRQPAPGGYRPARGTDSGHDRVCDRRFAVERPGRDPGRTRRRQRTNQRPAPTADPGAVRRHRGALRRGALRHRHRLHADPFLGSGGRARPCGYGLGRERGAG